MFATNFSYLLPCCCLLIVKIFFANKLKKYVDLTAMSRFSRMILWLIGLARLSNPWKLWYKISSPKTCGHQTVRTWSRWTIRDLEHCSKNRCTRPKPRTSTSYENALWTNGISWISASPTKLLESGERGFELVWLQEEDSLNIRCEHFSLMFYHFLKGSLWLFAGWLKNVSHATMHNCTSTTNYKKNT